MLAMILTDSTGPKRLYIKKYIGFWMNQSQSTMNFATKY